MTNLSPEHRVDRKSVGVGRFIVLALVTIIVLIAVGRLLHWLGDVAAMVLIICGSVAVAAVVWFGDRS
jgi:hypothetical protein